MAGTYSPGNSPADAPVLEHESALALGQRLEGDTDPRHLALAAILLAQQVIDLGPARRRRAIGDLRCPDRRLESDRGFVRVRGTRGLSPA